MLPCVAEQPVLPPSAPGGYPLPHRKKREAVRYPLSKKRPTVPPPPAYLPDRHPPPAGCMNTGASSCGVHDGAVVSGAGKQEGGGSLSCARRGSHPLPRSKKREAVRYPLSKIRPTTPYPPLSAHEGYPPPFGVLLLHNPVSLSSIDGK